jgi:hypothetical protein
MRRGSIFWGGLIVVVGVILLLGQLFPGFNAWGVFWPIVLILVGIWFLVGRSWSIGGGDHMTAENLNIPLADINEARIRLHHGAGRLDINPSGAPGTLLSGSFVGGVEQHLDRMGAAARLDLRSRGDAMFIGWPFGYSQNGLTWNLALTREIPLQLELETGASETRLNLQDLRVNELSVKTGASSTVIYLPANAGQTRVSLHSGAASTELYVPQGVAGRIRVQSGLAGINIDQSRFPAFNGGYETPGYDSALNKVEIDVETGVASVTIR